MSISRARVTTGPFAPYEQWIGSKEDVGYTPLLGASELCGWNMPNDPATDQLVTTLRGRRVLEIGPGDGERIALRAARDYGASVVVLDIDSRLLASIRSAAHSTLGDASLETIEVPANWWLDDDWVTRLAGQIGEVDVVVARQSLQFGSVETLVRVLKLADKVLGSAGRLWMQNMSPYLGYLYDLPGGFGMFEGTDVPGAMIRAIEAGNSAFAASPTNTTSGSEQAFPLVPFAQRFDRFLWVDDAILCGALALARVSLVVDDSFYFSPPCIWEDNKLRWNDRPDLCEREFHVAWLRRPWVAASNP